MWWKSGSHLTRSRMWQEWINNDPCLLSASVYSALSIHYLLASPPSSRGVGGFVLCGSGRGKGHLAQGHLATKREGKAWPCICLVLKPGLSLTRLHLPGSCLWGCWPCGEEEWLAWGIITLLERCVSSECMWAYLPPEKGRGRGNGQQPICGKGDRT